VDIYLPTEILLKLAQATQEKRLALEGTLMFHLPNVSANKAKPRDLSTK
jgi:hypothetical protein